MSEPSLLLMRVRVSFETCLQRFLQSLLFTQSYPTFGCLRILEEENRINQHK